MESMIAQEPNDKRPQRVTRAVQILMSALALGLITSIFQLAQKASGAQLVFASLIVIAVFGLGFFLIAKIARRRNWARIVLVVLVLFGLPFAIPGHLQEIKRNVLAGTVGSIITLLQLVGTLLLFTKQSNVWFRKRK
jgi:hypothetical protein